MPLARERFDKLLISSLNLGLEITESHFLLVWKPVLKLRFRSSKFHQVLT